MPHKDPEKKKEYDRLYAKKNRKKLRKYAREYYHRTNRIEYAKEWYKRNIKRNRFIRKEANKKVRLAIIEYMGGKCVLCNFNDWRALQIDHINGNGNEDRISMGHTNWSIFKRIKENPESYQLLCANCNWIKRYEGRELEKHWEKRKQKNL